MLKFACHFLMAGVKDSKKAKELRKAETTKKMFGSVPLPCLPSLCCPLFTPQKRS